MTVSPETDAGEAISPDLIERLRSRFRDHPVQRHLNLEILALELDRCLMKLHFTPEVDNGAGNIHGGVLASLADTAMACALCTNFDGKMGFATSNLNIYYLRRARTSVVAHAEVIKKGKKLCVGQVAIRDSDEQLVATVTCEFMLTTSTFVKPSQQSSDE